MIKSSFRPVLQRGSEAFGLLRLYNYRKKFPKILQKHLKFTIFGSHTTGKKFSTDDYMNEIFQESEKRENYEDRQLSIWWLAPWLPVQLVFSPDIVKSLVKGDYRNS